MRAGNLWDALLSGDPGVLTTIGLIVFAIGFGIWLHRARRPIPPAKGHPTVYSIQARMERDTEKEAARRADFEQLAQQEAHKAARAANAVTEVIQVTEIPGPRTPSLVRPYAQLHCEREDATR